MQYFGLKTASSKSETGFKTRRIRQVMNQTRPVTNAAAIGNTANHY